MVDASKKYFQVDPLDDRANPAYAALPERLYVLQDEKITFEVTQY